MEKVCYIKNAVRRFLCIRIECIYTNHPLTFALKENVSVTFNPFNLDVLVSGSVSDQTFDAGGWRHVDWDDAIRRPRDGTQKLLSLDP